MESLASFNLVTNDLSEQFSGPLGNFTACLILCHNGWPAGITMFSKNSVLEFLRPILYDKGIKNKSFICPVIGNAVKNKLSRHYGSRQHGTQEASLHCPNVSYLNSKILS